MQRPLQHIIILLQQPVTLLLRQACALLLLALLAAEAGAQTGDLRWLTLRDGLPGMSVTSFCEDPTGKMWIGTSNGIALYNGITFHNYALPRLTDGQPGFCHELTIDREGNVWAATKGGVFRLKRYDSEFRQVAPELTLTECILCVGDTVYVGARTGLFVIDSQGKARAVNISTTGMQENNSVRCLRQTTDKIWFTLRYSVVSIDKQTGALRTYPMELPSGLSRFDICGDRLFLGTKNNGLYVLDTLTGLSHKVEAISNVVNDVHTTGQHTLTVASDGSGAYLLDAETEQVLNYYGNNSQDNHLPTDAVYTYLRTKGGVDWIGMYQSGLSIGSHAYPVFAPYECGTFSTRGMKVTASLADGQQRLIAVKGGFWLVDTATQQSHYYDTSGNQQLHIMDLCRFRDSYYIGSFDGGLLRFDIASRQLSRLPGCQQLTWASVHDMAVSPQGQLWVASSEGIFIIDEHHNVVKNYTEKNSKVLPGLNSVMFDRQGNAWLGSTQGMCLFLTKEQEFKVKDFPNGFFDHTPRLRFTSQGDSIYAWSPIGIYRSDALMTSFSEVTLPGGVLGEKCMDFVPDGDDTRYIGTERGLFRIDNRRHTLLQLSQSWGIRGDIVSTGTLGMNEHHIWIATNEGLMIADKRVFTSDSLKAMSIPIEAESIITGQTLLSADKLLKANDSREITVTWNWVSQKLVVSPCIVDYGQHQGEIFEYRTDDGTWQQGNIGQPVELTSLLPGKHTLQMRLAGLEGSTAGYTVRVCPSWLFYLEVAVLIVALVLFLWWRSWRRRTKLLLQEHKDTEEALIEEMKDAALTDDRNTTAGEPAAATEETGEAKYQKSRIGDKELARLFTQMENYVKTEKPYLRSDSKMSDIAVALGVSPSLLSQVFTLYVKEPYYDYINKYRLEEFKHLIGEGRHKQFTITALSEQCGFKKTSFFSTFRKVEGTTPTEWIQKHSR